MTTRPDGSPAQDGDLLRQDGFYVPTEGPKYPIQPKGDHPGFPQPHSGAANPWHDATVEPTDFPILTITRSGQLDVMHHYWDKSWRVVFAYHDVVRWQTIELPNDVYGAAVKDGVTLT
jgi:hypothetical protein